MGNSKRKSSPGKAQEEFSSDEIRTLLRINKAIASIKNKIELLQVIHNELKAIIPFDSPCLYIVNEEEDYHYDIAAIHPEIYNDLWNITINALTHEKIPHKGSAVEEVLKYQAKLWNWKTEIVDKGIPHPYVPVIIQLKIYFAIACPLQVSGKVFGYFSITSVKDIYHERQIPFFCAVTDSIAVAVSNILAQEELLESERLKTLQIEIGKALAEEDNWKDRLYRCARLFQINIPYKLLLISIMSEDKSLTLYGFYQTGRDEYQILQEKQLLEISGFDDEQFKRDWLDLTDGLSDAIIFPDIKKKNKVQSKFSPIIMDHFRLPNYLIYPLRLTKGKIATFSFYNSSDESYSQDNIRLLDSIQNYAGLCFDRVLAYDEQKKSNLRIEQENKYLYEEIRNEHNFDNIIGNSELLKKVFKNISFVATAETTVLLLGETGTGKELIARLLHKSSQRNKKPFIKVNCATLPAQLVESELFGHERGSFTSAFEKRIGKFELAEGGSIFLDEIGELPVELQAKLLRVLQEKEFERVGGNKTLKCDVRIIAATNRVLEIDVKAGKFRADLYYRLSVFPITLPPLRERKVDIPALSTFFAQRFSKKMNKPFMGIKDEMYEALKNYNWPGNIRELENVIEQAVIVNQHNEMLTLGRQLFLHSSGPSEAMGLPTDGKKGINTNTLTKAEKEDIEKKAIMNALQQTKGRIRGNSGAASLLNIKPTTLESKMKKYEISKYLFDRLGG